MILRYFPSFLAYSAVSIVKLPQTASKYRKYGMENCDANLIATGLLSTVRVRTLRAVLSRSS
jgi:hypothetical protein